MFILLTIISFLYHLVSSKLVIKRDQVKDYGMDTFEDLKVKYQILLDLKTATL